MRVLQVTSSARRRGAEVFAHQLEEQLSSRGHRVSTVALDAAAADLPFELQAGSRFDPRSLRALAKRCKANDVVISHGGSTLAPVSIAAGAARRPFVYRNIGDPAYWGRARAANLRLGVPLRRAAHVVALYRGAASFMGDRYRLDPSRVTVASNAVDASLFPRRDEHRRRTARAELALEDDATVVGYLGSLSAEKRPEWALELAQRLPDATLVIAGDGPLRRDMEERSTRADMTGRVRFLGTISDTESFLAGLDLVVIPSKTEGVPGALLEAALVGVPVVATDVGGVGEVVAGLGAGLTSVPTDLESFIETARLVLNDPPGYVADRQVTEDRHDIARVALVWEQMLARVSSR